MCARKESGESGERDSEFFQAPMSHLNLNFPLGSFPEIRHACAPAHTSRRPGLGIGRHGQPWAWMDSWYSRNRRAITYLRVPRMSTVHSPQSTVYSIQYTVYSTTACHPSYYYVLCTVPPGQPPKRALASGLDSPHSWHTTTDRYVPASPALSRDLVLSRDPLSPRDPFSSAVLARFAL